MSSLNLSDEKTINNWHTPEGRFLSDLQADETTCRSLAQFMMGNLSDLIVSYSAHVGYKQAYSYFSEKLQAVMYNPRIAGEIMRGITEIYPDVVVSGIKLYELEYV